MSDLADRGSGCGTHITRQTCRMKIKAFPGSHSVMITISPRELTLDYNNLFITTSRTKRHMNDKSRHRGCGTMVNRYYVISW